MKVMFISKFEIRNSKFGSFPLALSDEPLDAAFDHVSFEEAQMIEEEDAVKMIHLVTERASHEIGPFKNDFLSIEVNPTQDDFFRTHDGS
jgi:hypothetical protein